jgi:hypothetical protein
VSHLVFAQTPSARLDLPKLVRNARTFFALEVDVLEELGFDPAAAAAPETVTVRIRLQSSAHGWDVPIRVRARRRTEADLSRARAAEGNARGMADLAARCDFVWVVDAEGELELAGVLKFAGLLASVALGPVLPPDDSALFGVRGAVERSDRLLGKVGLTR